MKFNCDNCGKIDEALFDGYLFGDRLLEGIMFKTRKNDDGTCEVSTVDNWDTDPYLSGLNKKKWLKEAKDFAEDNDIFMCPNCKDGGAIPDDMMLEEDYEHQPPQPPQPPQPAQPAQPAPKMVMKSTNIHDILGQMGV